MTDKLDEVACKHCLRVIDEGRELDPVTRIWAAHASCVTNPRKEHQTTEVTEAMKGLWVNTKHREGVGRICEILDQQRDKLKLILDEEMSVYESIPDDLRGDDPAEAIAEFLTQVYDADDVLDDVLDKLRKAEKPKGGV